MLRLFEPVRSVRVFERLAGALARVADELVVFAGIASVVLDLCATAIYHFEHGAQPEAFAAIPHAL